MRKIMSVSVVVLLFLVGIYTAPYFYEKDPVKKTGTENISQEIDTLLKLEPKDEEIQADEKPIERDTRDQSPSVKKDDASNKDTSKKNAKKDSPKKEPVKKETPAKQDTITKEKITVQENIAFASTTKNDSSIDKGKKVTHTKGVNGVRDIVYEVSYTNGKETSRTKVDAYVSKSPVNEVILVGTKEKKLSCEGLSEANALACLVNKDRAASGLSTLSIDSNLVSFAKTRAHEITTKFSHTRPNGDPYHSIGSGVHGENISFGYASSNAAHDGFMNSAGHRANNLRPEFKRIGTAMTLDANGSKHWVILFGY